jgi:Domain of unknown function (DUF5615)
LRLLLDEMYAPAIALELRGRGHDCASVHDAASPVLAGSSDPEVLSAAQAGDRALVTENVRDFRPLEAELIARGGHHPGLVYTSNRQYPRGHPATAGRLVRALDAVLRKNHDLRDRAIFLTRTDSHSDSHRNLPSSRSCGPSCGRLRMAHDPAAPDSGTTSQPSHKVLETKTKR